MAASLSLLCSSSPRPTPLFRPSLSSGSFPVVSFAPPRKSGVVLCSAANTATTEVTKVKKKPTGLSQPRPISSVLQEFLGVSEIPRTQALKQIWAYIKQHDLQDAENKKIIICDDKLKRIFGGKDRVGFLEIAGLLNPHFTKSEVNR